jgi:hypothetical protein
MAAVGGAEDAGIYDANRIADLQRGVVANPFVAPADHVW